MVFGNGAHVTGLDLALMTYTAIWSSILAGKVAPGGLLVKVDQNLWLCESMSGYFNV